MTKTYIYTFFKGSKKVDIKQAFLFCPSSTLHFLPRLFQIAFRILPSSLSDFFSLAIMNYQYFIACVAPPLHLFVLLSLCNCFHFSSRWKILFFSFHLIAGERGREREKDEGEEMQMQTHVKTCNSVKEIVIEYRVRLKRCKNRKKEKYKKSEINWRKNST